MEQFTPEQLAAIEDWLRSGAKNIFATMMARQANSDDNDDCVRANALQAAANRLEIHAFDWSK